jgi:hypothetical protein
MKVVYVEKCCNCPFRDLFSYYEWSEYDCEFAQEYGPPDKQVGPNQVESQSSIAADTVIPPEWCPLRKEGAILVQLSLDLMVETEDGKSQARQSSE